MYVIDSVLFRYGERDYVLLDLISILANDLKYYCKQIQSFGKIPEEIEKHLIYYGITSLMRQGIGVLKMFNSGKIISEPKSQIQFIGVSVNYFFSVNYLSKSFIRPQTTGSLVSFSLDCHRNIKQGSCWLCLALGLCSGFNKILFISLREKW